MRKLPDMLRDHGFAEIDPDAVYNMPTGGHYDYFARPQRAPDNPFIPKYPVRSSVSQEFSDYTPNAHVVAMRKPSIGTVRMPHVQIAYTYGPVRRIEGRPHALDLMINGLESINNSRLLPIAAPATLYITGGMVTTSLTGTSFYEHGISETVKDVGFYTAALVSLDTMLTLGAQAIFEKRYHTRMRHAIEKAAGLPVVNRLVREPVINSMHLLGKTMDATVEERNEMLPILIGDKARAKIEEVMQ